jgi:hypothetical protein
MKKMMFGFMLLLTVIGITACSSTPESIITETDDIMAFQAVSAAELLTAQTASPLALPLDVTLLEETTEDSTEEPIVADEIDELDYYLSMMDLYLGENNGLSVSVEVSDDVNYANKITFISKTLSGIDATYVLYFNEVEYVDDEEDITEVTTTLPEESEESSTETTETTPLGFKDQEKDRLREKAFTFADEEDERVVYALTGVLIINDISYSIEGKKAVTDTGEIMIMRSWIDHDNYVKVRYLTEDNMTQFFYDIVSEGVVLNRSKVRIVEEDNRLMVHLSFVEGDAKGRYEFRTMTEENVTYINVKYATENADGVKESGHIHIVATYDELTQETTYDYTVLPDRVQGQYQYKHEQHEHRGNQSNTKNPSMRG